MQPDSRTNPTTLVRPFPMPGRLVALAYPELDQAANGTVEQRVALGDLSRLPRPWEPASCTTATLRVEIWRWLDSVVIWLNHEYVFDPIDTIPACWPKHPHLVHEIAVLADRRRRAAYTFTSDAIEEWHRYGLPAFIERMHRRVADHCTEAHPPTWPAAGRPNRHLSQEPVAARRHAFVNDIRVLKAGIASEQERLDSESLMRPSMKSLITDDWLETASHEHEIQTAN